MADARHLQVLKNLHASRAGALGERLRDVDGIRVAVARNMNAADHIVEIGERVQLMNLAGGDHVDGQAEYLRHGGVAL